VNTRPGDSVDLVDDVAAVFESVVAANVEHSRLEVGVGPMKRRDFARAEPEHERQRPKHVQPIVGGRFFR